VGEILEK